MATERGSGSGHKLTTDKARAERTAAARAMQQADTPFRVPSKGGGRSGSSPGSGTPAKGRPAAPASGAGYGAPVAASARGGVALAQPQSQQCVQSTGRSSGPARAFGFLDILRVRNMIHQAALARSVRSCNQRCRGKSPAASSRRRECGSSAGDRRPFTGQRSQGRGRGSIDGQTLSCDLCAVCGP